MVCCCCRNRRNAAARISACDVEADDATNAAVALLLDVDVNDESLLLVFVPCTAVSPNRNGRRRIWPPLPLVVS